MFDDRQRNDGKSTENKDQDADSQRETVRKDLDDVDRTHGHKTGHYSWRQVAEACGGERGADHE